MCTGAKDTKYKSKKSQTSFSSSTLDLLFQSMNGIQLESVKGFNFQDQTRKFYAQGIKKKIRRIYNNKLFAPNASDYIEEIKI